LAYGLFALAAVLFIFAAIPETKGKSLEELETMLLRTHLKPHPLPSHAIE
jgi:hypothetical protein